MRKCLRTSNLEILMVKDHQFLHSHNEQEAILHAKNTQQRHWDVLCSQSDQKRGVVYTSLAEQLIQFNEPGQFPSPFRLDWMRVMVLKQPWLQTKVNTIIHAGQSLMKPCWKEQKSEHAVKVLMMNQNANSEGLSQVRPLKWDKTSVSSADSLLAMKTFVRLQHCNWTK